LPASTATSLDSDEQQVIQRLEGEWSWHGASLVNELRANTSRLLSVSVHTEFARLDLLAQDALALATSILQFDSQRLDITPLSPNERKGTSPTDLAVSRLVNQTSRTASFWTDLIMTLGALSSFRGRPRD
jgi:hypothetical protein